MLTFVYRLTHETGKLYRLACDLGQGDGWYSFSVLQIDREMLWWEPDTLHQREREVACMQGQLVSVAYVNFLIAIGRIGDGCVEWLATIPGYQFRQEEGAESARDDR